MQLCSLVEALNVPYRAARYVLEGGRADRWVRRATGSGHHRDMSLGEAFALAVLIKLTQAGLTTDKARQVTELVEEAIIGIGHQLNWDPPFHPFRGELATKFQWFVDVGDMAFFKVTTNANPSRGGRLEAFNWVTLGRPRHEVPGARPCVIIRLDLAQLASLVEQACAADRDN